MNKSTDSQFEPQQDDSRLKEFLRRASSILASERGWNERSQLKIKSLAEDLKLPADLYESGVQRLKQGVLNFEERFNVYEQRFIKYLHHHFERSNSKVLTAPNENKAIRIARREHEIPQVRARQLVRHVAEQLGMQRVSKLDAVEYVASVIDDQIGDQTIVADSVRGRIYLAARKWGVESAQVEILISNRLEANRTINVRPEASTRTRLFAIFLAMILVALTVWGIQHWIVRTLEKDLGKSALETESAAKKVPVFVPAPGWWSAETAGTFREFSGDTRSATFAHDLLKSELDGDRLLGYQELVKLSQSERGQFGQQAVDMFASFYADESLTIAKRMSALLEPVAELTPGRVPSNISVMFPPWRSADLLAACLAGTIDEQKSSYLRTVAERQFGIETDSLQNAEIAPLCKQAIANSQWTYLRNESFSDPESVVAIIDSLGHLTRQQGIDSHPLEYPCVINLLQIRPGLWTTMKPGLQRIIENADEDQLREIHLLKRQLNLPELESWLGIRLARSIEIETDRLSAQRIDEAISKRLNLSIARIPGTEPRWSRLREAPELKSLLNGEAKGTPQDIARAIHFGTVAYLTRSAEITGDEALLERADEMFDQNPRNVMVRTLQLQSNLPVYRRIQRRALPSDIRGKDQALRVLSNTTDQSEQSLVNAFERLGRAAPRIRDLTYAEATVVANFMLEADSTSTLVAIEKNASLMQHWANLGLAIADQISDSNGTLDQALTCCSTLFGFQPAITGEKWRGPLQLEILNRIALGLRRTAEKSDRDLRFSDNELRDYLIDQYRLRCTVAGVPGAQISAAGSPAELAELFILQTSLDSKIKLHLDANRYLATDELHLFLLHTSFLAFDQKSGNSRPKTEQPFEQSLEKTKPPFEIMLANEIAWLKQTLEGQSRDGNAFSKTTGETR